MAAVGRASLPPVRAMASAVTPHLVIIGALLVLAVPTILRLSSQVWTTEIGAHGPIVLVTGVWVLWRSWGTMTAEARPAFPALTFAGIALALAIYVFGRAYDFLSLEVLGLYGFGLSVLYDRFGMQAMLRNWFPLFYLGLLMPIPGWLLDRMTVPLKLLVSYFSVALVEPLGIPIVRQGVTMTVGVYQLLVEDACSGLNSLIGLISITLFYIYLLRNAGWRYSVFLVCLIIPVAIIANVLRIVALILLTYYFGDAVGQGFLHVTAGLFLFAISLLIMFGVDKVASRLIPIFQKAG